MTKKILLIFGIAAAIGIAAFLVISSREGVETPGESRIGFSIRDYFPFGKSENSENENVIGRDEPGENIPETNIPENLPVPRLRKISSEPVAGAVIWNVGTTSVVRFVEKGTGNVYEAKSDTSVITRLTNTTIPKIIRAYWLPDGSGFLAQTLLPESEIIETSFVKLKKNVASTTENLTPFATTISKLPTGIRELAIKPDGTKIFFFTVGSASNWYISNPDGTAAAAVYSHPLTEWVPKWVSANTVMMQNKGSADAIGYTFSFDVSNKSLKKVGVGAFGISANPNKNGAVTLISSGGTAPKLHLVDNKNSTYKTFSAAGLAEKCVWLRDKTPSAYCAVPNKLPSGKYPDVWYKGLIKTEDSILKIDMENDTLFKIIDLSKTSGQQIDLTDPSLSPDEKNFVFRNKIDGFLWLLRIEE